MERILRAINDVSDGASRFAEFLAIGRELKIVRPLVAKLTTDECRHVHTLVQRHLERPELRTARAEAYQRLRSQNAPLRLAGLAQWLVALYLETRNPHHETTELRAQDVGDLMRRVRMRANPPAAAGTGSLPLRGYVG